MPCTLLLPVTACENVFWPPNLDPACHYLLKVSSLQLWKHNQQSVQERKYKHRINNGYSCRIMHPWGGGLCGTKIHFNGSNDKYWGDFGSTQLHRVELYEALKPFALNLGLESWDPLTGEQRLMSLSFCSHFPTESLEE